MIETIHRGSHTPWGAADDVERPIPGLAWVGTPSHGGMHLQPELNTRIHVAWRNSNGWYEEDCEANIVVAAFPEVFPAANQDTVQDSLAYWFPEQHAKAYPEQAAARAGRPTANDHLAKLEAEIQARRAEEAGTR